MTPEQHEREQKAFERWETLFGGAITPLQAWLARAQREQEALQRIEALLKTARLLGNFVLPGDLEAALKGEK